MHSGAYLASHLVRYAPDSIPDSAVFNKDLLSQFTKQLKAQQAAAKQLEEFTMPRNPKDVMVANYAAYVKAELDMLSVKSVLRFKREATNLLALLHENELMAAERQSTSSVESQRYPYASAPPPTTSPQQYVQQQQQRLWEVEQQRPGPSSYPPPQQQRVWEEEQPEHRAQHSLLGHASNLGNLSFSSSLLGALGPESPGPSDPQSSLQTPRRRPSTPTRHSTPRREFTSL